MKFYKIVNVQIIRESTCKRNRKNLQDRKYLHYNTLN